MSLVPFHPAPVRRTPPFSLAARSLALLLLATTAACGGGDAPSEPGGPDPAPAVTIVSPAAGAPVTTYRAMVEIRVTHDEGLAGVTWSLNGGAETALGGGAAPYTRTFEARALADGENVILVRAADSAGVVGTAELRFVVQPPQLRYSVRPLPTPGGGESEASGLNDAGQVVGTLLPASGVSRAVLWSGGAPAELDEGPLRSRGVAVNSAGSVLFTTHPNNDCAWAHVWTAGATRDIEGCTAASDINDRGQVSLGGRDVWDDGRTTSFPSAEPFAGRALNNAGQVAGTASRGVYWDAVFWNGAGVVGLARPLGRWANALDVNDRGEVVGRMEDQGQGANQETAVLWNTQAGTTTRLGSPDGPSAAVAINASGVVAGHFYRQSAQQPGEWQQLPLVWKEGKPHLVVLASPEWRVSTVTGINASGQMSATATHPGNGRRVAVLLSPVP